MGAVGLYLDVTYVRVNLKLPQVIIKPLSRNKDEQQLLELNFS